MKWIKKGHIYIPEGKQSWNKSHAQLPIPELIESNRLRIYFGTRDSQNRTFPTFIEVDATKPENILYRHNKPLMRLGQLGCFDDSGVMPSWIINREGKKYLYYIGWNTGQTVPYRNSIGLAVSQDGGHSFERLFEGPIVDRTPIEPHFCAAPCVLYDEGLWKMWYLSCTHWSIYKGRSEPHYHIKYAESQDGISWQREGQIAIDYKNSEEAGIVRASVIKVSQGYRMWYSYRNLKDYRTDSTQSYRIGYAESQSGKQWTRKDEMVGIDISERGWDSQMIAYPYVTLVNQQWHMFYNGNGFGASGFGYAVLEDANFER